MNIKPFYETEAKTGAVLHENPLLNRIYQNRGVMSKEDIAYDLHRLHPPHLMMGMDEGTDLLIKHLRAKSKIIVVGDYDCDGATATTIAVEGIKMLGGHDVRFMVPDRIKHGYGLSPAIVKIVGEQKPDLIVTVDNGISSFEGAQAIRDLEHPCELLVTDHHLASTAGLPDADAIINPNQPDCKFPSKNIAGCGVMFYVILGLRKKMREQGIFEEFGIREPSMTRLLDVLAMGTIADVVPLDYNNRVLVSAGLSYINKGHARPGLAAVLQLKGREIGKIVASDMGFSAGPCFNAAGRLDDMTLGISCMLESNQAAAEEYANRLFDLNEQRKEMGAEMEDEARNLLKTLNLATSRYGVCLHDPHWHEGVIGILASRIKEKLNRPIIIFTDTHEAAHARKALDDARARGADATEISSLEAELMNTDIKGSARSVPGVHLKHILDRINKNYPEVLSKFGGHAMAAGMLVNYGQFSRFQEYFDEYIREIMDEEMILGKVEVDIRNIDPSLITLENADLLGLSGPWGQHFQQPLFSQRFIVDEYRILKEKHLKFVLRVEGTDARFDAIAFNCIEDDELPFRDSIEASFSLSVNEWRGRRTLQLMIEHFQDEEYAADIERNKNAEDEEVLMTLGAVANQRLAMKNSA